MITNRKGEVVTEKQVRAAIMRQLRCAAAEYTLDQRQSAVDEVLRDPRWLAFRAGQTLGSVARDGFCAALGMLS